MKELHKIQLENVSLQDIRLMVKCAVFPVSATRFLGVGILCTPTPNVA